MKYTIQFPTNLNEINETNDNLDVLVETEKGKHYSFVIATPDNIRELMMRESRPYLMPGLPFLFVERISEENIRSLIDCLMKEPEELIRIYGEDI